MNENISKTTTTTKQRCTNIRRKYEPEPVLSVEHSEILL